MVCLIAELLSYIRKDDDHYGYRDADRGEEKMVEMDLIVINVIFNVARGGGTNGGESEKVEAGGESLMMVRESRATNF